ARLGTVRLRHAAAVTAVAFAPDGRTLASGGSDHVIRLWEPATGRELARLAGEHKDPITALAYSPDGKSLVSGGNEGTVRLWDAATGKAPRRYFRMHRSMSQLALSADGRTLASVGTGDIGNAEVVVWETATGRVLPPPEIQDTTARGLAFSPDGKLLA